MGNTDKEIFVPTGFLEYSSSGKMLRIRVHGYTLKEITLYAWPGDVEQVFSGNKESCTLFKLKDEKAGDPAQGGKV